MKTSTCLLLGTMSLLLGISACTRQDDSYTQFLSDKRYQLDHTTKNVIVSFSGSQSKLSNNELESLTEAIKSPQTIGKTSVHVTLPQHTSGKRSGLENKRLKIVRKTLLKLGVKPNQIHESPNLKPQDGVVPIVLDLYHAIPTACLRDTGLSLDNFGCSTAKNMILMVDDPYILFKGEPAKSIDPARAALTINSHLSGGYGFSADGVGGGTGGIGGSSAAPSTTGGGY